MRPSADLKPLFARLLQRAACVSSRPKSRRIVGALRCRELG